MRSPLVRTRKPWGWEIGLDIPRIGQVKLIRYFAGKRTSLQYHKRKSELLIKLTGKRSQFLREESGCNCPIRAGVFNLIKAGEIHRVTGPALALEFSTYHPTDVVRLEDDFGRQA